MNPGSAVVSPKGRASVYTDFPPVEVKLFEGARQVWNLASCIFNQTSRNDIQDLLKVLRVACDYGGVGKVIERLGTRDVEEYPLGVSLYDISFSGLRQILPVAVVNDRFEKGKQRLQVVGLIPLEDLALGDWKLGHDQTWVDDGGGGRRRDFRNFMEARKEDSSAYLRAWISPYIQSGLEFKPQSWQGRFEFSAPKINEGNSLVEYYDQGDIKADFIVNPVGQLFLSGHNYEAKFTRHILHPKREIVFELSGRTGMNDKRRSDWPTLISGGEGIIFDAPLFARMSVQSPTGEQKGLLYDQLVSASVFPNVSSSKMHVDYIESMRNMLDLFSAGNPDALAGFNWMQFR